MSKGSRDNRWHTRHARRIEEAGTDPVKLEQEWLNLFTRGRRKWRDNMKVTITFLNDTEYNMNASTNYHPFGTRWPYFPPKRVPLIKNGSKP